MPEKNPLSFRKAPHSCIKLIKLSMVKDLPSGIQWDGCRRKKSASNVRVAFVFQVFRPIQNISKIFFAQQKQSTSGLMHGMPSQSICLPMILLLGEKSRLSIWYRHMGLSSQAMNVPQSQGLLLLILITSTLSAISMTKMTSLSLILDTSLTQ